LKGIGVVQNFMASENLNECVDELLKKRQKNQSLEK
jgi:hypothetical protein